MARRGWAALAVIPVAAAVAAGTTAVSAAGTKTTRSHHGRSHDCKHAVSGLDRVWLMTSIQGDRFEIAGGKLALKKSGNGSVRFLAKTLIKDHSKSLADAIELAHRYHIDVPGEPSPTQQWELEEVAELHGGAFDHDYAELEVADHVQDIEEASDEVKYGCNKDIRDDAKSELPTLRYHLKLAKRALATTRES